MVARKFQVLMKGLSKPVDLVGSSASNGLCFFGSEASRFSPVTRLWVSGTGDRTGGRPLARSRTKRQRLSAHAASGQPQIGNVEETTNLQVLVRTLLGHTVTLQLPHSPTAPLLELHISQRVGVPVHAF